MQQSNIVDITPDNFEQVIVTESQQKLVIIGFWTARDPSCIQLMETLASLAAKHVDTVIFAKIDVDSQHQIAIQFGIQSVPTVALFKEARPLTSFVGMKTPAEVDAFMAAYLPNEADALLDECRVLITNDDATTAFGLIKKAHQLDPQRVDIQLLYADINLRLGKLTEAQQLLEAIKMADQDSSYHALISALQLAKTSADSPQIQALQQQLVTQPDDKALKVQLAVQLSMVNRHQEALELLFGVLKSELGFMDAKKIYLDILATLPAGDPLLLSYRRKIYSLLY